MGHRPEQAEVRLLGGFGLRVGAAWVALNGPSARVVAVLGLAGHLGRADAAAMLWPDSSAERGQSYLRTALWRLNVAAAGVVVAAAGRLALHPLARVDARRLLDWAAGPASAARDLPVDRGDLGRELLPSWDEPWLDAYRQRLQVLVPEALEAHASALLGQGSTGTAMSFALEAHQLDPLRDSAVRILVRCHLAQGNRAAAARSVLDHRARLRAELGVDAGPDLLALLADDVSIRESPPQTSRQTNTATFRQTGR